MSRGTILPLVIRFQESDTVVAALMDDKSFNKSLEQKTLWLCHPETDRILPYKGEPSYISLERKNNYFEALLRSDSQKNPYDFTVTESDIEAHTLVGSESEKEKHPILSALGETIKKRHIEMPEGSYTTHLFSKGAEKIRKKVGEEAVELILAQKKEDIIYESADLIYHLMVLLEVEDLKIEDVLAELKRREN